MPRRDLPGIPRHAAPRGNDRQPRFFTDADRYRNFKDRREIAIRKHCNIHAHVPMTNHGHLMMTPEAKLPASSRRLAAITPATSTIATTARARYRGGHYSPPPVSSTTALTCCAAPAISSCILSARPHPAQSPSPRKRAEGALRRLPRHRREDATARSGYRSDPLTPATPACAWVRSFPLLH